MKRILLALALFLLLSVPSFAAIDSTGNYKTTHVGGVRLNDSTCWAFYPLGTFASDFVCDSITLGCGDSDGDGADVIDVSLNTRSGTDIGAIVGQLSGTMAISVSSSSATHRAAIFSANGTAGTDYAIVICNVTNQTGTGNPYVRLSHNGVNTGIADTVRTIPGPITALPDPPTGETTTGNPINVIRVTMHYHTTSGGGEVEGLIMEFGSH